MKPSHIFAFYISTAFTLLSFSPALASLFQNSPSGPAALPFLNAYATKSGTVPLLRDDLGFYAAVDLASHSSDASDTTPNPDTVNVMLAVYTPQTVLTSNCLNFSNYTCNYPTCNPFSGTNTTVPYPFFTGDGYAASALVYLDYSRWALNNVAAILTSCNTSMNNTSYGSEREGIVGLGVDNDSIMNYLDNPIFSIFIAKDRWSGYLVFTSDMTRVQEGTKAVLIACDGNWTVTANGINTTMKIGENNFPLNVMITFDISVDMLGFPLYMYNQIMTALNGSIVNCNTSYIQPSCDYNGSISNLPNISLHVGYNETITIPPEVYVQNASNQTGNVSSVVLNMRALADNMTGENYVTSSYANYIILDLNFMSYYYVVFNYSSKSVTQNSLYIYIAGEGKLPDTGSNRVWIWIVVGIVGVILLVGAGCCVYHYFFKKRKVNVNQNLLDEKKKVTVKSQLSPAL